MLKLKTLVVFMVAFAAAAAGSRAEIPVEIDIALLAEEMDAGTARELVADSASEAGLSNRDGQRALAVLDALLEKGVPAGKAYEAVSAAVQEGNVSRELKRLDSDKSAASLKREAAREDLEESAGGLSAEDVAVAVEILDGLIEEGVPVEKARDIVKEALSAERNHQAISERASREGRGRRETETGRPDTESLRQRSRAEEMRERIQERVRERLPGNRSDIESNLP